VAAARRIGSAAATAVLRDAAGRLGGSAGEDARRALHDLERAA
jgi:hypothetical protein